MLKIVSWNVNSIKARLPVVMDWIDQAQPDVLLLQEIKCVDEAFPALEFEAKGFRCAVRGQKTYNGVAILSRRPIVESSCDALAACDNGEARYIEALLEGGVRVASIYVPNGQTPESDKFPYKLGFLDGLHTRAKRLLDREEPLVLAGDYNLCPEAIDLYDPAGWEGHTHFHPEERKRFRKLLYLGLTDAFRAQHPDQQACYTWWDYRAGAYQRDYGLRIDHLLISPQAADRMVETGIDREVRALEKASDHSPTWVTLDV